jgi:hypothetical protein
MQEYTSKLGVIFRNHNSKNNSCSMKQLSNYLDVSERKVRDIVAYHRENNPFGEKFIVGTDEGYWLTDKIEELEEWLKRYTNTAKSIFKTAAPAIKRLSIQKQKEFYGDLFE